MTIGLFGRVKMALFATLISIACALALAPKLAHAESDPCRTPRGATDQVFKWQQPGHVDLDEAVRCLDMPKASAEAKYDAARAIRMLYDRKLAFITMEDISDDPEFKDEKGRARIVPHQNLPKVTVERRSDGRWMWTASSIARVGDLAAEHDIDTDNVWAEKMPESLRGAVFGIEIWQYLAILGVFILGLIARKIIQYIVLARVQAIVKRLGQQWALKMVDVFASPGATLLMAGMLALSYPQLGLPVKAGLAMSFAVRMLVVLSVVWAAYRLVDVISERMAEKAAATDTKLDDQLVPLVRKSLKVLTIIVGVLFMLQNLNVDVGSLLAGLGIGGLAFALAAKDTLANFFGSVMIFVDRPFQIGDWVVAGGCEGIVEEVGFRSTRLRTFYNSLMTVPNSKIMDANVDNYGARQYRRCFTTLNLTYDTTPEQMQAFCEGVRAIIKANPATRKDYYEVHMSGFGAHSLDVMLYFFFEVETWTEEITERHNVFLEIMRLARELGVDFAFPTQTLFHEFVRAPAASRPPLPKYEDAKLAEVVRGFGPGGKLARPAGPKITAGYWAGQADGSSSDVAADADG